jgi:hypothetical protein
MFSESITGGRPNQHRHADPDQLPDVPDEDVTLLALVAEQYGRRIAPVPFLEAAAAGHVLAQAAAGHVPAQADAALIRGVADGSTLAKPPPWSSASPTSRRARRSASSSAPSRPSSTAWPTWWCRATVPSC